MFCLSYVAINLSSLLTKWSRQGIEHSDFKRNLFTKSPRRRIKRICHLQSNPSPTRNMELVEALQLYLMSQPMQWESYFEAVWAVFKLHSLIRTLYRKRCCLYYFLVPILLCLAMQEHRPLHCHSRLGSNQLIGLPLTSARVPCHRDLLVLHHQLPRLGRINGHYPLVRCFRHFQVLPTGKMAKLIVIVYRCIRNRQNRSNC